MAVFENRNESDGCVFPRNFDSPLGETLSLTRLKRVSLPAGGADSRPSASSFTPMKPSMGTGRRSRKGRRSRIAYRLKRPVAPLFLGESRCGVGRRRSGHRAAFGPRRSHLDPSAQRIEGLGVEPAIRRHLDALLIADGREQSGSLGCFYRQERACRGTLRESGCARQIKPTFRAHVTSVRKLGSCGMW